MASSSATVSALPNPSTTRVRPERQLELDGNNAAVTGGADHWDQAYGARGSARVSWYEPRPRLSLEIVSSLGVARDAPVIDIGGGASTLADELVARGYTDVSVLDLSQVALRNAQARLGPSVMWLHEDVLTWEPERLYTLWHDRALLHFFTEHDEQQAYLRALDAGVQRGGFVVLGVFAPDAPERCSGLPVQRYAADELLRLLGKDYVPRLERYDVHVTPKGARQPFTWVAFERRR